MTNKIEAMPTNRPGVEKPLVSVGIAAYNRPDGLRRALQCITSQTYTNLEIIVSDDCSHNVEVSQVVNELLPSESRIRFYRQERNLGSVSNIEFVLRMATGKYFLWADDEDLCEPEFVGKLVECMESHPDLVACACDVKNVDQQDNFIRTNQLTAIRPSVNWDEAKKLFFRYPISNIFLCVLGMFKTEIIKKTNIQNWSGWRGYSTYCEVPFLAHIATLGRIAAIPEVLKTYRLNPSSVYHTEFASISHFNLFMLRLTIRLRLCRIAIMSDAPVMIKMSLLHAVWESFMESSVNTVKEFMVHMVNGFLVNTMKGFLSRTKRGAVMTLKETARKVLRKLGLVVHRYVPPVPPVPHAPPALPPLAPSLPPSPIIFSMRKFEIDLVMDVGANTGQFASEIRRSGYVGKIVSFEPLSQAYDELLQSSAGDSMWYAYPRCAIGDHIGEVEINIAGNSQSSSILPMLESHRNAAPESAYQGKELVPIKTLDSVAGEYLKSASAPFLKIDTQGFEWHVLDGARDILPKVRGIIVELSLVPLYEGQHLWREVIDRLEAEGFTLWAFQPVFSDMSSGRTLQVDGIFYRAI